MAERTSIEWCDHTWTLVVGCDPVSPACAKCYAALMAARLEAMGQEKYRGLAKRVGNIGKWTGEVRFDESVLDLPARTKKPGVWFLTSMGDIAHEKVTDDQLAQAFGAMEFAHWHTFLVLTKRIARITDLLRGEPLPNIWIGCTAENQEQADAHKPHMRTLAGRGWKTFVSYEPALGPVDWKGWEFLGQLISGGESGHGARPSHPDWHRAARDFAARNGIAYLFKQWGACVPVEDIDDNADGTVNVIRADGTKAPVEGRVTIIREHGHDFARVGKKAAGRLLDGRTHDGFPAPTQDTKEGG